VPPERHQISGQLIFRGGGQAEGLAGDRRSAIDSARQPLPAVIGAISECESHPDAHALERNGSRSNASRSLCRSRLRLAQPYRITPRVKLLKIPPKKFDFLTFEELSRLTEAVKSEPERWALVLLGADAGLRQGEMIALEWGDVDLVTGTLTVRRSSWRGIVGTPKSGRERKIPLTARLKAALKAHRHLRSELVFCHSDGKPFTQSAIDAALRFGSKRAGLRIIGSHVLRHTFCSHLAMRGAAPKTIQELVGHSTLSMTLRYMHLAPSELCEAIGLLNFVQPVGNAEAATG
jgi:integrase